MSNKYRNRVLLRSLSVLFISGLMFGVSQSASASGFAIAEQSGSGLGNAFAGGAASANDASTVWYNPAGMTRLKKTNAVAAFHSITPSLEFTDQGSSVPSAIALGGDGGDAGESAIVPNIYFTMPLADDITFGVGINGPFGLSTKYDSDWKGRYYGVESAIKVVNINPSLAFKVDDALSLGVGINFQQMDVLLSKAINSSGICLYLFERGLIGTDFCGPAGLAPASDAFGESEGTSTSWGANLGLMYEFTEASRLGFAYRTVVRHHIKGDGTFTDVNPVLNGAGMFQNTDISADIVLPASASLSFYHDIMSNLALMADITWTEWSKLDEVRIVYDTGTQGDTVEELGWSNTLRYAVGATYKPMTALTVRAGLALDESPVDNKHKRSVRLPDNNRLWFSIGAGYEVMRGLNLDLSYALLTINDAEIDITEGKPLNSGERTSGNLKGEYALSTNIISVQADWKF